jgi:hypothetical protein
MDDIQDASSSYAQTSLLDQVSTSVLAKSLKGDEAQAAELLKSLDSNPPPLPAGSGVQIDFFA